MRYTCLHFLTFGCLLLAQCLPAQFISVYPGDITNNGRVNNVDFLYMGLAYNYAGPARDSAIGNPQAFLPQPAQPWSYIMPNGVNMAHADCNGDGLVNFSYDAFPLYVNYGSKRNDILVTEDVFTRGMAGLDPQLRFVDANIPNNLHQGSSFSLPIELGTASIPAENVYGLAFSVFFDSAFVNASNANFDFNQNSWANPDNDRVFLHRKVSDYRVDVAWTRTDHNMRNGFGQIGRADFIIIIDVIGFQEFKIKIDSIKMIDKFGNEMPVVGDTVSINIGPAYLTSDLEPGTTAQVQIQPNPASEYVWVSAGSQPLETLVLWDAMGRAVAQWSPNASEFQLQLPKLPEGLYWLESRTKHQRSFHKLRIKP
ncbi:MAG: T9SS type A sorting domain-containing protein [Bacteroidetes bacterium]|nr:T9SS type A sorting domain-containing protein [Bacteroidota bacterium]